MVKLTFEKLHKVSGSTLFSLLVRLAYFNNWYVDHNPESLALGEERQNSYKSIMGDISLLDIVVQHTRWNRSFLESNYKSDFSITILRDPVDTFESVFHYVDMQKFYNVSSFQEFIRRLEFANVTDSLSTGPYGRAYGRNQHSWSLGLNKEYYENKTAVSQLISKMESNFDLVLITEYFDESIALLRTLLGGPIPHYLFQNENERLEETKYSLSKKDRTTLQNWLKTDMMVYKHFLNCDYQKPLNCIRRSLLLRMEFPTFPAFLTHMDVKFLSKVSPEIQKLAQQLRKLNKQLENYCQMKKKRKMKNFVNNFEKKHIILRNNDRSNLYCSHYGTPTKEMIRAAVKNFEEVKRLFSKG